MNNNTISLNELMSRAETPLQPFLRNTVFFHIKDDGTILDSWNIEASNFTRFFLHIKNSGSLLPFLLHDQGNHSSKIAKESCGKTFLIPYHLFPSSGFPTGFYTNKPVCQCRLIPTGNNDFLASLSITEYYANTFYYTSDGVLWINRRDFTISGINHSFFFNFNSLFREPSEIIGKPISGLLSPELSGIWNIATFDDIMTQWNDVPNIAGSTAAKQEVTTPRNSIHFIPQQITFNPVTEDFLLEIVTSSENAGKCLLMIGRAYDQHHLLQPDSHGYSAAIHPNLNSIQIKRGGHIVAQKAISSDIPAKNRTTLRFIKSGQQLHFICNEEVVSFHEFDYLWNDESRIYIGIRPNGTDLFSSLRVSVKKEPLRKREPDLILRVRGNRERFYTVRHLPNSSLSAAFPDLISLVLPDITSFQENVARIQSMYHKKEKEESKLRIALEEAKGENTLFMGNSPESVHLREKAALSATTGITVLIQGETGTGKEVLANFIHSKCTFSKGRFVKVDCSALSPSLIESELFGHEKGAFTGAIAQKKGKFEEADGGVLFIDEIHNLSIDIQAKLLSFLQDFTITRVGGTVPLKLKLKLIVATNAFIPSLVKQGLFRSDLYYRINALTFTIPPLRSRMDDIPLLASQFLKNFCQRNEKTVTGFSGAVLKMFYQHDWSGNVRELKNVVERAAIFCDKDIITPDLIIFSPAADQQAILSEKGGRPFRHKSISSDEWSKLLSEYSGNINMIAKKLQTTRAAVYYNLLKNGLSVNNFRKYARSP